MEENKATAIERFVENNAPVVQELKYNLDDGNEFVVKVYPVLPFRKRVAMVKDIFDYVIMPPSNNIKSYVPAYIDFAQRYTTIAYFTDVELPAETGDAWRLLDYTPLFDDVSRILGDDLQRIFAAANERIAAYRSYLERKTDINAIVDKVTESFGKVAEQFPAEKIEQFLGKIQDGIDGNVNIFPSEIMKAFTNKEE